MVLSYFLGRRLFKGKAVDPAWAARGRVIYHRPASWWNKHPYLIVGGIAIMTFVSYSFQISNPDSNAPRAVPAINTPAVPAIR